MTDQQSSNIRTGMLLALAGFGLFACGDALYKHLGASYAPLSLLIFNSIVTVIVLLIASPFLGGWRSATRSPGFKWHMLRGVSIAAQCALFLYALPQLSLTKAYALIFTAPLICAIIAHFSLRERAGLWAWLAIALGFFGVLIILRPGFIAPDMYALMVLGSACLFANTYLLARKLDTRKESLFSLGALPTLATIIFTAPFFALNLEIPRINDLPIFAVMGALSACAFICLTVGFSRAPAARVAPIHYTQILWGTLFSVLFFGDRPDLFTIIGASVIIAAGLILLRANSKVRRPDPCPAPVADAL